MSENRLTTITGGLLFRTGEKVGNFIKFAYFVGLWPFLYVALRAQDIHLSQVGLIFISATVATIVLVTKVVVMYLNKKLDDGIDVEQPDLEEGLDEDPNAVELPPGISLQLWNRRDVLFQEEVPMDERVLALVQEGFDTEMIFHLVQLINDGTVSEDTTLRENRRRAKVNLIVIGGRVFRWDFDRETLASVFARPSGVLDVVRSTVIAFLMTYALSFSTFSTDLAEDVFSAVLASLCVLSMLRPPGCEAYSTTLNDPTTGYTRATLIIFFCSLAKAAEYCRDSGVGVLSYDDWDYIHKSMCEVWKFLPILLMISVFGHPITTLHMGLEAFNMYVFGIAGSASILSALYHWSVSAVHGVVMGVVFYFDENPSRVPSSLFAVIYMCFVDQFSLCDFSWKRLMSVILWRLIVPLLAASGMLAILARNDVYSIVPYSILVIHIVLDVIVPLTQTYTRYLFVFYGKLFDINGIVTQLRKYYRYVTVSLYLMQLLMDFDVRYNYLIGPILVMCAVRTATSVPHLYAFALILSLITLQIEFCMQSKQLALILGLVIARKCVVVMRSLFLLVKLGHYPNTLFGDPFDDPKLYLKGLMNALLQFNFFGRATGFELLTFLWSCVTGAPPLIWRGVGLFLFPSAPRPSVFYDAASVSAQHDGLLRCETSHTMEVPVYTSMVEELENKLFEFVKEGRFGVVTDDSFYLLMDNDLMAILHIVSIEANCLYFQLRGLEYVQQTLCHGGEGSILQQLVLEQRGRMATLGRSLAYLFSTFQLRATELPLDMVSVSTYQYLETVYFVLGNETLQWFYRAVVFLSIGTAQAFSDRDDNVNAPLDYSHFKPEEKEFLELVLRHSTVGPTQQLIKQIDDAWTYIYASLTLDEEGRFEEEKLLSLFDGNFDDDNAERKRFITECTRFGVVLSFNASAGLAPFLDEENEFITYMNEQARIPVFSITDDELIPSVATAQDCVISMKLFTTHVEIIRFASTATKWAVFQLETQAVKGFWTNEARDILYNSITSSERAGIQFDLHYLRNITNQSCNPPMGYPIVVSNVNQSMSKR